MNDYQNTIRKYFEAQNTGTGDVVASLFADGARVVNVNLPPFEGKEAILKFCSDLYARTTSRNFTVATTWLNGASAAVQWKVDMTFRAGATVGPFELETGFDVNGLEGVNVFEFDGAGKICSLRIFHETTTVGNLAKSHAKG